MNSEAEIEAQKIRGRDKSGKLVEVGFFWGERRPRLEYALRCFDVGLGCFGLLLVATNRTSNFWTTVLVAAAICGVLILVARWSVRSCRWYHREVIFCSDGRTLLAPNIGCREPLRYVVSRESHHSIVSIEHAAHPGYEEGTEYGVKFHYRSGRDDVVTMNQYREVDARVIAMQLSLALQELREAMGQAHAPRKERVIN
jgi:hypothetical protein